MFALPRDSALREMCLGFLTRQLQLGLSLSNAVLTRFSDIVSKEAVPVSLSFPPRTFSPNFDEALPFGVLRESMPDARVEEQIFRDVVDGDERHVALEMFLAKWGDPYLKGFRGCRRVMDQDVLLVLDSTFSCRELSDSVRAWFTVPVATAFVIEGRPAAIGFGQEERWGEVEIADLADHVIGVLLLAFDGDAYIRFDLRGQEADKQAT